MSSALGLGPRSASEFDALGGVLFRVVRRRVVGPDLVTIGVAPDPTIEGPVPEGRTPAPRRSSRTGPIEPVQYRPGQFVMVWVPGVGEIPISVSGLGDDGSLELTVKAVGATSSAVVAAPVGELLGIRGPYGTAWPVEEAADRSVLVVSGGLGLAPLRRAVLEMLDGPARPRRLEVLHGARVPHQLVFVDEHDDWVARGATVRTIVDRPDDGWLGAVGNVIHLLQRVPERPDLVMVCGPEVMMRAVVRHVLAAGVRAADVHVSLERNMHCAVGICGRCQLGPWVLCRDGAVMPWARVARVMEVPGR